MMIRKQFFRRRANRFCVYIPGFGLVPVAEEKDDAPIFVGGAPRRVGDDAIIKAEGKLRHVRLLKSRMYKNAIYLVDMGPAKVA